MGGDGAAGPPAPPPPPSPTTLPNLNLRLHRRPPPLRTLRIPFSHCSTNICNFRLMKPNEMDDRPEGRNPVASLPDEVIVVILSRLPVRFVCRFKCVSRSWCDLISDPGNRRKLPHTLAGFFYRTYDGERSPEAAQHFTNVSGRGPPFVSPSFSFLPVPSADVLPVDCCNGLLLCHCILSGPPDRDANRPFYYAVCNPATEKWVMLPPGGSGSRDNTARLCFDPAVSSHFSVIEYVSNDDLVGGDVVGLEIYSSRTGTWSSKEPGWTDELVLAEGERSVFLNGFLNTVMLSDILAIDMEGEAWRIIPLPPCKELSLPCGEFNSLHQVQGQLCFFDVDDDDTSKLTVHVLQDNEWVLKHRVSTLRLFGWKGLRFEFDYKVIAVHLECNLVFFVYGRDNTLMAYEMDRREGQDLLIQNRSMDSQGQFIEWNGRFRVLEDTGSRVFLHGFLHTLVLLDAIVAVDMEGKTSRTIPLPPGHDFSSIH
ncbi:hypothetical protein ACP4OV_001582 [Aristida adscensionis]